MKKEHIAYLFYFLLIAYLAINTGLASDDYNAMALAKAGSFKDILMPSGVIYFIDMPVLHFTHYIAYYLFSIYSAVAVNIFKIAYLILSFYMISQFFKIYLDGPVALLVSLLFIFFPSHDSTVYMFMCQYLMISFALYLYAFYLAHHNRLLLAFLFATLASFTSYGSTAIAVLPFVLFILHKEYRKAAVMAVPNIIYSAYFMFLTMFAGMGSQRVLETVNVSAIGKQFLLQILTFADAIFGPSMWLKIYYSFSQLSIASLIIGLGLVFICYVIIKRGNAKYDSRLVISFSILLPVSFLMFAVTGRYPQMAFNMGNRVTIYGSLLVSYLLILMPGNKKVKLLLLSLLIFTTLGISDHWKKWDIHKREVILSMRDNKDLQDYGDDRKIYVSGNQYSKYGPISNIEFLSEDWVDAYIFRLLFARPTEVGAINKRFRYADGYLVDTKYGKKAKVDGYINVYDSEKNRLLRVSAEHINSYIDSLPADKRHWVQFIDDKFMKGIVLKLMPRLHYAL